MKAIHGKTTILAGALYFVGLAAGVFSVVPVIDLPEDQECGLWAPDI